MAIELVDLDMEAVRRLDRDLRDSAKLLTPSQARFAVDLYYQIQEFRKRTANQKRAAGEDGEPVALVDWLFKNLETLEGDIRRALGRYSQAQVSGRWAMSIVGIGPVLSAGLLAHIDITQAPTVGHIWRFAGLDPTVKWEKKTRRPWNARLKTLCWLAGESFVKVSHHKDDVYGHIYAQRKELEQARNEAGEYAEQAATVLATKRIGNEAHRQGHRGL